MDQNRIDALGKHIAQNATTQKPTSSADELRAQRLANAVDAAAIQWCGEKERETFNSDIQYFRNNWRAFPGLREYVERALANEKD